MSDMHLAATGPSEPAAAGPRGFGGWLILPIIGTFISPLWNAYGAYDSMQLISAPHFPSLDTNLKAWSSLN
jgi:hypothetical protein